MKCRYPFDTKRYEIKIENPIGDFAHENFPESRYANDFILPFGAPVLAIKGGVVFLAKHDSNVRYTTQEIRSLPLLEVMQLSNDYTNLVSLDHDDGTSTEYCHLTRDAIVSNDQSVDEGAIIGYVGLSGITDRPHLHFNPFIKEKRKVVSIPVEFVE